MTDTERKECKRKLIKSITIIPENFEYCEKHNIINGTLLIEIERVMEEYFTERLKDLAPTEKEIENYAIEQNSYKRPALPEIAWARGARWMLEKLTGKSEEKRIGVTAPIVTDEEIKDKARIYANNCEFKSNFPHDWQSSNEGYIDGFKACLSRFQPSGKTEQLKESDEEKTKEE